MISCAPIFWTMCLVMLTAASTLDLYKNARLGSRIISTRYGRLQGLLLPLDNYKFLRPIEAYLGVPYATPPIKSNRYVEILTFWVSYIAVNNIFPFICGLREWHNDGKTYYCSDSAYEARIISYHHKIHFRLCIYVGTNNVWRM